MRTLLNLSITTVCTQRCPFCAYGMNSREQKHAPIHEIARDCEFFGDITELTITGGEPTTHPEFKTVVDVVRKECPNAFLRMETNGTTYPAWHEVYDTFGCVIVTRYSPAFYEGCKDNSKQIDAMLARHKNVMVWGVGHTDTSKVVGSKPCAKIQKAHYSHGLIYGCCIGPGIEGNPGIPVGPHWQTELDDLTLPCHRCWSAEV